MARLKFCGFDYTHVAGNPVTNSTTFTSGVFDFALDSGMLLQSFADDAVSYAPGATSVVSNQGYAGRNSSDGGCIGYRIGSGNSVLNNISDFTQGITCTRSTLGNPSELWVTMDICHGLQANVDNPATLQRAQSRFQIFKWGDLSLRLRRIFNYATGPERCDVTFELFNVTSSLGTITLTSVNSNSWMHVRIHAKLDAAGAFEVTIDGVSSNHTGINTVATTPLASATQLWFSAGALGIVSGSITSIAVGSIDNLLIDNAAFPAGRPSGRRLAITGDSTLSGWAPSSGSGTVATAVSSIDSNSGRGTGSGSVALLNLATLTTTGLNTDILGWQIQACGVSNVDTATARKLVTGVDVGGVARNGANISAQSPPLTPSEINPGIDTVFYNGGTTNFTLTNVTNTKLRLAVTS
jgi:hypothetical protein